jgi:hypothetical protein
MGRRIIPFLIGAGCCPSADSVSRVGVGQLRLRLLEATGAMSPAPDLLRYWRNCSPRYHRPVRESRHSRPPAVQTDKTSPPGEKPYVFRSMSREPAAICGRAGPGSDQAGGTDCAYRRYDPAAGWLYAAVSTAPALMPDNVMAPPGVPRRALTFRPLAIGGRKP